MAAEPPTVREFGLSMDRFIDNVENATVETVRSISCQMFSNLVRFTPVDTGFARAGWNMSVGAMDVKTPTPGKDAYPAPAPPGINVRNLDDEVHITNAVVYIIPLENGHSQQRPNGITTPAFADLDRKVKEAFKRA